MAEKDLEHLEEEDLDLLSEGVAQLSVQMKQLSHLVEQQMTRDRARFHEDMARFDRIDQMLAMLTNLVMPTASEQNSGMEADNSTTQEERESEIRVQEFDAEANLLLDSIDANDVNQLEKLNFCSQQNTMSLDETVTDDVEEKSSYSHVQTQFDMVIKVETVLSCVQRSMNVLQQFSLIPKIHQQYFQPMKFNPGDSNSHYFGQLFSHCGAHQNMGNPLDRNILIWDPGGFLLKHWWRLEVGIKSTLLLIVRACEVFAKMLLREYLLIFFATS